MHVNCELYRSTGSGQLRSAVGLGARGDSTYRIRCLTRMEPTRAGSRTRAAHSQRWAGEQREAPNWLAHKGVYLGACLACSSTYLTTCTTS
jgi:hypothetical protein